MDKPILVENICKNTIGSYNMTDENDTIPDGFAQFDNKRSVYEHF